MESQTNPTRGEVARGMRSFISASAFWGAWGQATGIGTAMFTGYALLLGADESFIALLTSMAYLLGLTQLLAPLLAARAGNPKRFITVVGYCEIALRCSPVLVPFLLPSHLQLPGLMLLVGASLLCGHAISPSYGNWVSSTIPENIRARFTSRQTIISTLVAMISGFAMGKYLDMVAQDEKQEAFIYIFALGALCGWLGYYALSRAPFPKVIAMAQAPSLGAMVRPFRDANFLRAALFYGTWTFALGIAGSLYSVFMIDQLRISYTEISLFNALFMVSSIGGYRFWAGLVDRFGSKPVLQILTLPASLIPFLWIFNKPDAYYLIPVALLLSGLLFSGIMVSINPLLYGMLPQGQERPFYLASWSAAVNVLGALGPLTGSFLARFLKDMEPLDWLGYPIGGLQLIFALSACMRLLPIVMLHMVKDPKGFSSLQLLGQMRRGNLLSYAYNAALYQLASSETRRAQAALALGRSGNPLAIEQLIQALSDASPLVRSNAARALGETGSEEALESLIKELHDGESDVRSEAAEALGQLGYVRGIDPLIQALEDPDPRVQISAIRGLAEIDSEEVRELLFWHFGAAFNPLTFPTLVDVLSNSGDTRLIKPTIQALERFGSPAIRLQLLNGVCRALGGGGNFYRLLSLEVTQRTTELSRRLRRTGGQMSSSRALDSEVREALKRTFERLVQAYENDNSAWVTESTRQIAGTVRDGFHAAGYPAYEVLSVYVLILALNTFLDSPTADDLPEARDIFLTVCLGQLADLIQQVEER